MTRTLLVVVAGVLSCFIAQGASAQPRWGRDRTPNQGACFYEDSNFRGNYFCVREGDQVQALPGGMGDKISSIRVFGGAEATVFRDSGMRGRSARFIADTRDLKREGWNDQISSIDISRGRDYSPYYGNQGDNRARPRGRGEPAGGWTAPPPAWGRNDAQNLRDGACFYEDTGFRGQSFCLPRGATYASLPHGFNDRISSIRVMGGGEVVIFENDNFRGRSQVVPRDIPDLRGSWKDSVSSIRVF